MEKLIKATAVEEGEGARVQRLFPGSALRDYDPFVLFDEFFVEPGTGFPEHPHRGFEAVTYMLEGAFHHKDNLGNDSEVSDEGLQRFSAGRGLVHSEMPGKSLKCHGIQLWINLPRRHKSMEPTYQQVNSDSIPEIKLSSGRMRILVGEGSPVRLSTPIMYSHLVLNKGASFEVQTEESFSSLLYTCTGAVAKGDILCRASQAIIDLEPGTLSIVEPSVFLILSGFPHKEPILHNGPFVD